ncbi:MAG: TetR/AcrR family transcriptional regulator [Faecousia sp.]
MRVRNEEEFIRRKNEIMEKCYDCYAEHGLGTVGIKGLAEACGCTSGSLYTYFSDLDDLIVQSTAYCMSKVEEDFMANAPESIEDVWRFIDEIPYWTAIKHGKKYRLMYQVYTHPKYLSHGKEFFEGVNRRYSEYAAVLESKIGISKDIITPLIFILIRASVHYALFEDEFYLQAQQSVLKKGIALYLSQKDCLSKEENPL